MYIANLMCNVWFLESFLNSFHDMWWDESDEDVIDIDRDREMLEDVMSDVLATDTTQTSITMEALIDAIGFGLVGGNTYLVIMMECTRREDDKNKMIDPG